MRLWYEELFGADLNFEEQIHTVRWRRTTFFGTFWTRARREIVLRFMHDEFFRNAVTFDYLSQTLDVAVQRVDHSLVDKGHRILRDLRERADLVARRLNALPALLATPSEGELRKWPPEAQA